MAKKIIKRADLVAADAITSVTDEAKKLVTELEKILTAQKEVLKNNPFKSSDDVKKHKKATAEANTTINALLATRKKLEQSRGNAAKLLASEKLALQEKNKALKEEAKDQAGLISLYKKKSDRLRDLKNEFKDATLEGTKSRKELDKMRKSIINLDDEMVELDNSVNDSFRNIGKYSQAIDKTKKQLLKLAAAGAVAAGSMQAVKTSLQSSEEGSEDLRKATGKLEAALSVTKNTVATAAIEFFSFTKGIISGEKTWDSLAKSFEKTTKAVDEFGEKIEDAADASDDAVTATIELEKVSRGLREEVEELNGVIARQNAIAGDTTKGMDSIADANERALAAEQKRNTILVGLAESEKKIIDDLITAKGKDANVNDLLNQQSAKEIELIALKNELSVSTLDLNKLISENERDRFEKGLDFALDLFDTQKTLNERGIADENKTFEERIKLLNRTKVLAEEAFQEQIRLAEKQTGAKLKLNELVALDDQKLIYERVNNSTQDEIVQQRILDIIRDRKTALLDLSDAEKELSDSVRESNEEKNKDLNQFYADREKLENEFQNTLLTEQEREIQAVREKYFKLITLGKEYGEDVTKLTEDQQSAIAAINKKYNEIEEEKEEEKKEKKRINDIETIESGVNSVGQAMDEESNRRISKLDEETEANADALDRQERRAEQGLENNAAALQAQQDKLKASKQREQKEQERNQKILAYYNLASEYAKDDANTAPFKALATIGVMEAVTALFEEGTDKGVEADMSGSKVRNTGKDDYLGRTKSGKAFLFDGREKIMGIQHSAALTDYTNQQIVDIVQNSEKGGMMASISLNDSRIVSRLDSLEKSINNSKVSLHIDENAFVTHTQFVNGMKKVSKSKPKRLY